MQIKKLYLDLETGGLTPGVNPILQIAAIAEINGEVVETFNEKMKPLHNYIVDQEALDILKIDMQRVEEVHRNPKDVYLEFIKFLGGYVNKYDSTDKFYLVGYNIHSFDSNFLRDLFLSFGNKFFGSYFFNPPIDIMLVSAYAAIGQRQKLVNFKLGTVAQSLGIEFSEDKAHDALYDAQKTREISLILDKGLKTLT